MGGSSSQHEICDVYLTEKELHQLHLDGEALRETLKKEASAEKEREERIRQKQADDELFMFLDIDDSDLLLTPVLRTCSSTHVETSTTTQTSVRKIPGHAGIVQAVKLPKQMDILLGCERAVMSTQEYMKKVVEDVGDIKNFLNNGKLDQVVAIVKSCTPNVIGDLTVTMKKLSGTIPGIIHHNVVDEGDYGKDITVGAALILTNALVFSRKPSIDYLNITMRNVIKIS
ncbi:transposase, MuDR, MULE transposase domain protein [Tanacetum coccineum]